MFGSYHDVVCTGGGGSLATKETGGEGEGEGEEERRRRELEALAAVRRPVASLLAAVWTELYLCHVCSCQEILTRTVRGQEKDAAFREKDPIGWETKSRLTKRLSIDTRLAGI
eukprot:COSAG02_NODE_16348_length_1091_cov_0.740927_1_plen_113_part_00